MTFEYCSNECYVSPGAFGAKQKDLEGAVMLTPSRSKENPTKKRKSFIFMRLKQKPNKVMMVRMC